jgi:hypothetical protein
LSASNTHTKGDAGKSQAPNRLVLDSPASGLRASDQLTLDPEVMTDVEREQRRELWNSAQMSPEEVLSQRLELQSLRNDRGQFDAQLGRMQTRANQLQTELRDAQDNRFHHPLVYAGAAALVGASAMWIVERRKRLQRERIVAAQRMRLRDFVMGASTSSAVLQDPLSKPAQLPVQAASQDLQEEDLHSVIQQEFQTSLPGLEPMPEPPQWESVEIVEKPLEIKPAEIEPAIASNLGAAPAAATKTTPQAESVRVAERSQVVVNQEVAPFPEDVFEKARPWWKRRLRRPSAAGKLGVDTSYGQGASSLISQTASTQFLGDSRYGPSTVVPPDTGFQPEPGAMQERQVPWPPAELTHPETVAQPRDEETASWGDSSQSRDAPEAAAFHVRAREGSDHTMEELLELRTSVQALVALNRGDEAIMMLDNHIQAHPNSCAWVYLEFFSQATRMERRDLFDEMRQRYRLHFNRLAPYWGEISAQVTDLQGYPKSVAELSMVWPDKGAKGLIENWLVGPQMARRSFQLPAYQELFDLYELIECIERGRTDAQDFVPTVSLLDLDYEFSTDVRLDSQAEAQAARSVPIVKTGDFAVDFNTSGTQLGSVSMPAALGPDAFADDQAAADKPGARQ